MEKPQAARLLEDIELVIAAHDRLIAAKERIRSLDPSRQHGEIANSPVLATWLYFKGFKTDEQVLAFIKEAWDKLEGKKSQLWVWHGPDHDEPIPEGDRLLDRIDMAMGLIAQRTQTAVPVKSVRDYGWHPEQHLRKILAFAQAATDLSVSLEDTN